MAVVTPATTDKLDNNQVAYGSPTSEATFKQMAQNQNQLIDSTPIGSIVAIAINQPGVPTPNPDIWQLCDGSEITQEDSPLRSSGAGQRFTPDLTDKFLRGSDTGSAGSFDGQDNINLSQSVPFTSANNFDENALGDPISAVVSVGSVNFSFSNVPGHYTVAYYMKIN